MEKPIYTKIGVKPVYGALVHRDAKEGPCRVGNKVTLSPQTERNRFKEDFKRFIGDIKDNLTEEVTILKPVYIEYGEDFTVREREFKKLEDDLEKVDLFLLSYRVPGIERYRKPIAMIGRGVTNVDISAYLRDRGREGYALFDYDELNELISLLRVRKAVAQTRILRLAGEELIPWGVVSSIYDFGKLKDKFGIECRTVHFKEFFEKMEGLIEDEKEQKNAKDITDRLIKNADKVHMRKEDITKSICFYLTVRRLMEEFGCNAFTSSCFELCGSKIPAERKFTPCLTHTLLKDEGYPSSCEEDISVLLSMILLMYISKKSSYMGNPSVKARDENIMTIIHDVPGLKMHGLKGKNLPYEIRNFTVGGWGAHIRYNFSQDKEKMVTLGRFSPSAEKILIMKGEIVRGLNFNEIGCSLGVEIKLSDAMRYFHLASDFGHHLAMVYGDYTQKMRKLGELMGFETVEI